MSNYDQQSEDFLNSSVLGDDFFNEIVEKKLGNSRNGFKLQLILLSPATGKNENYVSVLYRAKIKIEMIETNEKKSVDVIIKASLTLEEMKTLNSFHRERAIYEKVLKSVKNIWFEIAAKVIKFGPQDVVFKTNPYEIIVLDDLKAAGYEMLNRKVGLNMEQTKMLLMKLAKFHAASAILYQESGKIDDHFDRKIIPLFPEEGSMIDASRRMLEAFETSVRNNEGFEYIANKISNWNVKKFLAAFTNVAEPMKCGFQVMNHGDVWVNNLMFRFDHETNSVNDVLMIDYELSFWGSPAADLLYFLITSVEDNVKVEHFDTFISFYHEQLSESLKMLKYVGHIPTLSELHIDLLEKGFFACSSMTGTLFFAKYDSNEEFSMEIFLSDEDNSEKLARLYDNDNYKKAMHLQYLPTNQILYTTIN
ncbi:CLUMA_CG004327, isoform A [Clunio marinus]|uniref:CLUMA_CG004327, isoform A n=1 Tax=Clunio marinus TaxID=568069 RepID=A0A1J1HWX0_9DIPT|nr:CLUMA_CG004327, isoform A [Clunio marinus]